MQKETELYPPILLCPDDRTGKLGNSSMLSSCPWCTNYVRDLVFSSSLSYLERQRKGEQIKWEDRNAQFAHKKEKREPDPGWFSANKNDNGHRCWERGRAIKRGGFDSCRRCCRYCWRCYWPICGWRLNRDKHDLFHLFHIRTYVRAKEMRKSQEL